MQLDTELKFINQASLSVYDFDQLYKIERSGKICERTEITIEKKCPDGGWNHWFDGYIAMVDGKWNVDQCLVKIKPRSLGSLACLVDRWEDGHNLVKYADFETSEWIEGEIEEEECCDDETGYPTDHLNPETGRIQYATSTGCLSGTAWNVLRNEMSFRLYNRIFNPQRGEWTICTTHIREKWTGGGAPTSYGWSDDGGDYVRPIPTMLVEQIDNLSSVEGGNLESTLFFQQYARFPDLSNGLALNDILEGLISERCEYEVVSNFFGINPDATNPTNEAYNYAIAHLQELMVFDVNGIRFDQTEAPTNLDYSYKDIWDDLKILFNLQMREKDGKLYIEHVSYFQDRYMLDLTTDELKKHIHGKWEYEYKKEELPRFEEFSYGLEPDGYFRPLKVMYEGDCVTDEESKTDSYIIKTFVVDVYGVFFENEKETSSYSDEALVLVATNAGVINRYPVQEGSGAIWANGVLTWSNIFDNLHKWGRKKRTGIVQRFTGDEGENTQFYGRPKNKQQKDIRIPMCCEDLDQFAPEDYIKTQLGWGEVEDATYDAPNGILTLNLLHD